VYSEYTLLISATDSGSYNSSDILALPKFTVKDCTKMYSP